MGVARWHSVSSLVRGYSLVRGFIFRVTLLITRHSFSIVEYFSSRVVASSFFAKKLPQVDHFHHHLIDSTLLLHLGLMHLSGV